MFHQGTIVMLRFDFWIADCLLNNETYLLADIETKKFCLSEKTWPAIGIEVPTFIPPFELEVQYEYQKPEEEGKHYEHARGYEIVYPKDFEDHGYYYKKDLESGTVSAEVSSIKIRRPNRHQVVNSLISREYMKEAFKGEVLRMYKIKGNGKYVDHDQIMEAVMYSNSRVSDWVEDCWVVLGFSNGTEAEIKAKFLQQYELQQA